MIDAPRRSRAAVFIGADQPFELQEFALPDRLPVGGVLCRVRFSTICGSDLHTWRGRRVEPCPSILGHESVGEVVALGGPVVDGYGHPVSIGDRVTWTIMAACGACRRCLRGLPQKCERLHKYGHARCDRAPALTGGYAEYIELLPGSTLFRVPGDLPDELAAPANCALATVVHGIEAIPTEPGDVVMILGAGLLGIYLTALVRAAGARRVLVVDPNAGRGAVARRFGADEVLDPTGLDATAIATWAAQVAGEVDAAYEVCGSATAVDAAVAALRIGGRLLVAGLVTPGSTFTLDGNNVTRRMLTLRGIHNYRPEHLGRALSFLCETSGRYPYAELVGATHALHDINAALAAAEGGGYVRFGVRCGE